MNEEETMLMMESLGDSVSGQTPMMKTQDDEDEERKEQDRLREEIRKRKKEERESDGSYPVVENLKDAKAALSYHLLLRFQQHIEGKTGAELDDEDTFECLSLLLKTQNFDSFQKSWDVISGTEMEMHNSMYQELKEEAKYYYSVMTMLFEKDEYNT